MKSTTSSIATVGGPSPVTNATRGTVTTPPPPRRVRQRRLGKQKLGEERRHWMTFLVVLVHLAGLIYYTLGAIEHGKHLADASPSVPHSAVGVVAAQAAMPRRQPTAASEKPQRSRKPPVSTRIKGALGELPRK